MYDLHYWPTPNGHKVTLFLEEMSLPYTVCPVDIRSGAQFEPAFLKIAPNNRMPALVDHETGISLFESGAILLYLADKHAEFIAGQDKPAARAEVLQWLFWQMAGLGPMLGQANHFRTYAPEQIPYAVDRYTNEAHRLFAVMDRRLADRPFLAGEAYSIADMASYPWVLAGLKLLGETEYTQLGVWAETIKARPATVRAYALGDEERFKSGEMTEEQRKVLFGQTAATVR